MEWVGTRKPSMDTRLTSGSELMRKEREEERCLACCMAACHHPTDDHWRRKVRVGHSMMRIIGFCRDKVSQRKE